ncbi:unnamed protein product, partial [Mesorhabditis belari]|uniref:Uncharacterized protein n=1 Tax=Mesorhabditis belari TaxID=2138241 RepID=A0AAF3EAS8_9BILA
MKVRLEQKEFDALKKFESLHHPDIWNWIMDKVGRRENLNILDVSEECAVFAVMLAEQYPTNKVTCLIRGEKPKVPLPSNVSFLRSDFKNCNWSQIEELSTYDVIIVNELTHEIPEIGQFFKALKKHLNPGAPIVVLSRPKNPPLPVPECCLLLWRKLMPTKEEITAAAAYAQLGYTTFSAAVPISVDRFQWESMLYSGCFPAVRATIKCGEPEIRQYCNKLSPKVNFEEKMSIYVFRE